MGQYSLHFARERARAGEDVTLAGFSSTEDSVEQEAVGEGRLTVLRFKVPTYDRNRFLRRMLWTLRCNLRLLWKTRRQLRAADEILFTGSPPFLLHFIAPLNLLLRRKLVYRITDFHPECLMAALNKVPLPLRLFHRLTIAWRKTVDQFEILGEDQRRRLMEIGIPTERIKLKRDLSPVRIESDTLPLERPAELAGRAVLLYSGNFGVAHDHETFLEAYKLHHLQGSGRVGLWLNAIGAKADLVEQEIRGAGLPIHRSRPVPLDQLSRLLVTPDAHLITLRDPFVGFVLPSKVYGCIESGRDIVYIGSDQSDIHLLCQCDKGVRSQLCAAPAECDKGVRSQLCAAPAGPSRQLTPECDKGVRSQLCAAPAGPSRQLTPDPIVTHDPFVTHSGEQLATSHSRLYSQAPVGDVDSVAMALEDIADRAELASEFCPLDREAIHKHRPGSQMPVGRAGN